MRSVLAADILRVGRAAVLHRVERSESARQPSRECFLITDFTLQVLDASPRRSSVFPVSMHVVFIGAFPQFSRIGGLNGFYRRQRYGLSAISERQRHYGSYSGVSRVRERVFAFYHYVPDTKTNATGILPRSLAPSSPRARSPVLSPTQRVWSVNLSE